MKLLKIDTLYPAGYLNRKKTEFSENISKMSFIEYHQWLIDLKLCFSDFYIYNLALNGWDAHVFYHDDDTYLEKATKYYFGIFSKLVKYYHKLRNLLSVVSVPFAERILEKHIKTFKPDVLFIREGIYIRSSFWNKFRNDMLLVSRVECLMGDEWSPLIFDLIYTNIESYKEYFKTLKIPVLSNSNGFDPRILDKVKINQIKKYDVTFIGGLGTYLFERRTLMFEEILKLNQNNFSFNWWGDKLGNDFDYKYPLLAQCYMGFTGGIEMYQIYADSKIVINDYGDVAGNTAVNMRIFETMGVGTVLLTRKSPSINMCNEYIQTFENSIDCIEKIMFLLNNLNIRAQIAKKGQDFVLENYNYQNLMKELSDQLLEIYKSKFNMQQPTNMENCHNNLFENN